MSEPVPFDPDAPLVALVRSLAGGQTLSEMVRKARFRRKRAGASEGPAKLIRAQVTEEWMVNTKDDE